MADPVLDEDHIVQLLTVPVRADTISYLQQGAVQAMIDLYDRKVTREDFIEMLAPCIALYGQAAKLWILANIEAVHDSGELDKARFIKARHGLAEIIQKQTASVVEVVEKLAACPTSQDKVH